MGYIHDVNSYQFLPPHQVLIADTISAWSHVYFDGAFANVRAAGAGTGTLLIPLQLPSNSASQRGAYIKSIDVWYKIITAALTTFTVDLSQYSLPANTLPFSVDSTEAFTLDSGHDGAAERITVADHKMTMTIDTPFWLDTSTYWGISLVYLAPATSVIYYRGAQISYTWRL